MRPVVGIGCIIVRDGKVLLGKRLGSHGTGSWCFPGGHLEHMEEISSCAKREVLEETGLVISDVKHAAYTNDFFPEGKHYVTLFVTCEAKGEPSVLEPEKCSEWKWFNWKELPSPLFVPIENLVKSGWKI